MARRVRERFSFWLDITRDDDFILADHISDLKRKRRFSRAIRDGLALLDSLHRGEVDLLLELFPWVADAIAEQGRALPPGDLALPDPADDPHIVPDYPRPMRVEQPPAPTFDDDDTELLSVRKAEAHEDVSANFMSSIGRLQS